MLKKVSSVSPLCFTVKGFSIFLLHIKFIKFLEFITKFFFIRFLVEDETFFAAREGKEGCTTFALQGAVERILGKFTYEHAMSSTGLWIVDWTFDGKMQVRLLHRRIVYIFGQRRRSDVFANVVMRRYFFDVRETIFQIFRDFFYLFSFDFRSVIVTGTVKTRFILSTFSHSESFS